jgi:hypothetical protein
MVMSATYKQSSTTSPVQQERDPENRLLARGPRYRLPAWMLRDQALFLSGLLVEKQGGPPVKPYQPEGVWEDFSYGKITYQQDHGEALYRRSLYTFWRRSVAPTTLFDVASRRVCQVRLARTNTPLQALTLLNDVTFVEAARVFAERLLKESGSPENALNAAFYRATSHLPSEKERLLLSRSYQRSLRFYSSHPEEAKKLLNVGEWKSTSSLPEAEMAACTATMSLILNLDETLCKE